MDRKILGKNIKNRREEVGMFQSELAKRCDVSAQAVSSWEIGRTEPKFGSLIKMSEALNCTISDLLFGTETEEDNIMPIEPEIPKEGEVTEVEMEVIQAFRKATPIARMKAYGILLEGKEENGTN